VAQTCGLLGCASAPVPTPHDFFEAGVDAGVDCITEWAEVWNLPTESAALVCKAAAHGTDAAANNGVK